MNGQCSRQNTDPAEKEDRQEAASKKRNRGWEQKDRGSEEGRISSSHLREGETGYSREKETPQNGQTGKKEGKKDEEQRNSAGQGEPEPDEESREEVDQQSEFGREFAEIGTEPAAASEKDGRDGLAESDQIEIHKASSISHGASFRRSKAFAAGKGAARGLQPDILVVGGGIVGTSVALDAAGRGYSVVLLEKKDIGAGTTSRTSRMAHGGLRYLEYGAFGLVRESLRERDILCHRAPDLVRKRDFFLPDAAHGRLPILIGTGLFLYDLLALSRDSHRAKNGFFYRDAICVPEPLAARTAGAAIRHGAEIRLREGVVRIETNGDVVSRSGERFRPRVIVLALGPWVDRFLEGTGLPFPKPLLNPSRGAHLFFRKKIDRPVLLQAKRDGRVFFGVPCLGGTLVGTTDIEDRSDPDRVFPTEEEKDYLWTEWRHRFPEWEERPFGAWAGLRPLVNEGKDVSARTREERIVIHPRVENLVVIVGGKLTTARAIAEKTLRLLERRYFKRRSADWTREERLTIEDARRLPHRGIADILLRRTAVGFYDDPEKERETLREWGISVEGQAELLEREYHSYFEERYRDFGIPPRKNSGFFPEKMMRND